MTITNDFIETVKQGDLASVTALLDSNPTLVNARSQGGTSAVLLAAYYQHSDVAQLLVDRGASLDVFEASTVGDTAVLSDILTKDPSLVNSYAADGFYPLGLAAFFGNTEAVKLLLEKGADVSMAARNVQKVTALHASVANQHLEISRLLLEHGADVNAVQQDDFTPLMEAVQNGQIAMVELLLQYNPDLTAQRGNGQTALDIAQEKDNPQIIALLEDRL